MPPSKKDIIAQLQRDILPLQGYRPPAPGMTMDAGLGPVAAAFPNASFPTGAVHEFLSAGKEHAAATGGFITGVLHALMGSSRACIWIGSARTLFPPALRTFGVDPSRIIFIDLQKERDALWAMEEALKCEGLAAVVGEIQEISFTASRRLQLAVEQSRVTGFILRHQPRNLNTIACVSRWKITPLPSELEDNLPGVGFPRWQAELLKIRNGKPGSWTLEWSANRFHLIHQPVDSVSQPITSLPQEDRQRQTG
jgi:protein ImuA